MMNQSKKEKGMKGAIMQFSNTYEGRILNIGL